MLSCNGNKAGQEEKSLEEAQDNESLFTSDLLIGSMWKREVSIDEDMYIMSFTKCHFYSTRISNGDTSIWKYEYYLSSYRPVKFDTTKVGQKTRGDFLVMSRLDKQIVVKKLYWITPQTLEILYPRGSIDKFIRIYK